MQHAESSAIYDQIRAEVGDGWTDIIDAEATIASETERMRSRTPLPKTPSALAAEVLDGGITDYEILAEEVLAAEQRFQVTEKMQQLLGHARQLLVGRRQAWNVAHEEALCKALHQRRSKTVDTIRSVEQRLSSFGSLEQIVANANASAAYAEGLSALERWEELRKIHLDIIDYRLIRGDGEIRLLGLDWVSNYEEAWGELHLVHPFHVEKDGSVLWNSVAQTPPWEVEDPRKRITEIARVEIWTPTRSQYLTETRKLDQQARTLQDRKRSELRDSA